MLNDIKYLLEYLIEKLPNAVSEHFGVKNIFSDQRGDKTDKQGVPLFSFYFEHGLISNDVFVPIHYLVVGFESLLQSWFELILKIQLGFFVAQFFQFIH